MNKFIFVIFFMTFNVNSSPRIPLTFQVSSSITRDVLDYKITSVDFSPKSIFLEYDKEIETFVSAELLLEVKTNIPADEGGDNFTYSLSMIKNEIECVNQYDEIIKATPPDLILNDLTLELNTPVLSLSFDDETDNYLSDKNTVILMFHRLDKSISSCSGNVSVEVGVDV
ncbi:hypothetical protein [Aliivibrio fischeri]|uniref:hypothetical protein n=1 Tax=Aliivibrio fischeri TaxID=668 RepID=UPI0012DA7495|nr:hypothetical protein [Aliivibrio fischeri]MUJ38315.1 hypothetical protein [Aliivibrio fischeri]